LSGCVGFCLDELQGSRIWERERLHTLKVIAVGFILLAAFVLVGRALGSMPKAAVYFLPVWLIGTVINLWYGVSHAGYSVKEEAPIFLLVFAVPAIMALLAWWKLPAQ
jgi:hypothetical protein